MRAYKSLDTFRAESRGMSWILTIARRVCLDHARSAARRQRIAEAVRSDAPRLAMASRHDESTALVELIDRLPDHLCDAFVLVRVFGFSYADVAGVMGIPIGTVQSRVARARATLVDMHEDQEVRRIG